MQAVLDSGSASPITELPNYLLLGGRVAAKPQWRPAGRQPLLSFRFCWNFLDRSVSPLCQSACFTSVFVRGEKALNLARMLKPGMRLVLECSLFNFQQSACKNLSLELQNLYFLSAKPRPSAQSLAKIPDHILRFLEGR